MRTKKRLLKVGEDFEPSEAIEQAVKKRKYLIQKATGMLDDTPLEVKVPELHLGTSGEEANEDDGDTLDSPIGIRIPHPYRV